MQEHIRSGCRKLTSEIGVGLALGAGKGVAEGGRGAYLLLAADNVGAVSVRYSDGVRVKGRHTPRRPRRKGSGQDGSRPQPALTRELRCSPCSAWLPARKGTETRGL